MRSGGDNTALLRLWVEDGRFGLDVHFWVLVATAAVVGVVFLLHRTRIPRRWQTVEATVSLGSVGHVTIRPDHEVARIAHEAWTEIVTRKAGLLFDEANDLITEVYNSWYELFREVRALTKSIPADRLGRQADAQKLAGVLISALNQGLRPHLTKWQARFRRWYAQALDQNPTVSPQEVQRQYPQFSELLRELRAVNEQLMEFASILNKIAHGEESALGH